MRAVLVLLSIVGCARGALPSWSDPLVRSPHDALPARPDPPELEPPRFPNVEILDTAEASPTLMVIRHRLPHVTVAVSTRRGNDGSWPVALLPFTVDLLADELAHVLPDAHVASGVDIYGAWLTVTLPRSRLRASLDAIANALAGTVSPSLVERHREADVAAVERNQESPAIATWMNALDHLHGAPRSIAASMRVRLEEYREIEVDRVRACRDERFAASDMMVLVAGPMPSEARAAFEGSFGSFRNPARRPANRPERVVPEVAAISEPSTATQAHALFARRAPSAAHPDRLAFDMLVNVLGGSLSSRLNGSLRETHAYTYGAFGHVDDSRLSDVLRIQAAFRSADVADAIAGLFEQMRRIRTQPITQSELEAARARVWVGVEREPDVQKIVRAWQIGVGPRALERRYSALANVTPEHLRSVARRHFDPHGGVFVLTGDFSEIAGVWVRRDADGFHLGRD